MSSSDKTPCTSEVAPSTYPEEEVTLAKGESHFKWLSRIATIRLPKTVVWVDVQKEVQSEDISGVLLDLRVILC